MQSAAGVEPELGTSHCPAPGQAGRRQKALAWCRAPGEAAGGQAGGSTLMAQPRGQLHHEGSTMETLEVFTQHLTQGAETPLSRFRLIFTWVATNIAYDVSAFLQGLHTPAGGETGWNVLRTRKATCSGYSDLLQCMCRLCGIKCLKIQGHAKGAGYIPGYRFTPDIPNHEWNAVLLDGRWYLVDVCWSAGYLQQASQTFVFKLTDHYYLTEPEVFVIDHLPMDSAWQLFESPRTLEEFQAAVHFKQGYFQHGLSRVSPNTGVVSVDKVIDITLEFLQYPLSMTYELRHLESSGEFSKCVSFCVGDSTAQFSVRPPMVGTYTFKVYGKVRGCQEEPVALTTHTLEVNAVSPVKALLPWRDLRFPWGPTRHLSEFGLEEVGSSCSCLTPGRGCCQVTFRSPSPGVSLKAALYELMEGGLRRCQPQRTCQSSQKGEELTVTATPPSPGHYWLSVYGSEGGKAPGKCVANYLICSVQEVQPGGVVLDANSRWRHDCTATFHHGGSDLEDGKGSYQGHRRLNEKDAQIISLEKPSSLFNYFSVELASLGNIANMLVQVCTKIKYHSQKSCIRFLRYIIE